MVTSKAIKSIRFHFLLHWIAIFMKVLFKHKRKFFLIDKFQLTNVKGMRALEYYHVATQMKTLTQAIFMKR